MQTDRFWASLYACSWDQSAGSAAAVPPGWNKGDAVSPGPLPCANVPALPAAASAALPHAILGSISGEKKNTTVIKYFNNSGCTVPSWSDDSSFTGPSCSYDTSAFTAFPHCSRIAPDNPPSLQSVKEIQINQLVFPLPTQQSGKNS